MNMQKPDFSYEQKLWQKGYEYLIGIDEVGRGAFAGPVVAAAVSFSHCHPELVSGSIKIDDSKRLSPQQRTELAKWIKKNAFCYSIAQSSVPVINKQGITKATFVAFRRLLKEMQKKLKQERCFVLVDGFYVPYLKGIGLKNQRAIVKGDQKSISIASASIIAKVYRDNLMRILHKKYPAYGFWSHKGYGTRQHQEALKKNGLSTIHRTSFNLSKFVI